MLKLKTTIILIYLVFNSLITSYFFSSNSSSPLPSFSIPTGELEKPFPSFNGNGPKPKYIRTISYSYKNKNKKFINKLLSKIKFSPLKSNCYILSLLSKLNSTPQLIFDIDFKEDIYGIKFTFSDEIYQKSSVFKEITIRYHVLPKPKDPTPEPEPKPEDPTPTPTPWTPPTSSHFFISSAEIKMVKTSWLNMWVIDTVPFPIRFQIVKQLESSSQARPNPTLRHFLLGTPVDVVANPSKSYETYSVYTDRFIAPIPFEILSFLIMETLTAGTGYLLRGLFKTFFATGIKTRKTLNYLFNNKKFTKNLLQYVEEVKPIRIKNSLKSLNHHIESLQLQIHDLTFKRKNFQKQFQLIKDAKDKNVFLEKQAGEIDKISNKIKLRLKEIQKEKDLILQDILENEKFKEKFNQEWRLINDEKNWNLLSETERVKTTERFRERFLKLKNQKEKLEKSIKEIAEENWQDLNKNLNQLEALSLEIQGEISKNKKFIDLSEKHFLELSEEISTLRKEISSHLSKRTELNKTLDLLEELKNLEDKIKKIQRSESKVNKTVLGIESKLNDFQQAVPKAFQLAKKKFTSFAKNIQTKLNNFFNSYYISAMMKTILGSRFYNLLKSSLVYFSKKIPHFLIKAFNFIWKLISKALHFFSQKTSNFLMIAPIIGLPFINNAYSSAWLKN